MVVAGTTIARRGRGVLIRGASGSGKSDLALRALTQPLRLPGEDEAVTFDFVSDDQTVIKQNDGELYASAPETIAGLIEARGIGLIAWPCADAVTLALVADTEREGIKRLPEPRDSRCQLLDVALNRIDIIARENSSVVKLAIALAGLERRFPGC
jgi:HPr kinase/phosphorylase